MKPLTYHCIDPNYCFGIAHDANTAGCSVSMTLSVLDTSKNVVVIEGTEEAMKAFSDRRMDTETTNAKLGNV